MRVLDLNQLPPHMRDQAERQLRAQNNPAPTVPQARSAETFAREFKGAVYVENAFDAKLTQARTDITAAAAKVAKPSKYRNVRVFLEGEWWDSKAEYEFFCDQLRPRKLAGEIALILRQVPMRLEGGVTYRLDFLVILTNGDDEHHELWDVKGYDTQASRNKRKQVLARYGTKVRLWRRGKGEIT